jgi:hypothetical protein
MDRDTSIPEEFGGTWEASAREWCSGGSLGHSPDDVGRALSTLGRLWPIKVKHLITAPLRGLGA